MQLHLLQWTCMCRGAVSGLQEEAGERCTPAEGTFPGMQQGELCEPHLTQATPCTPNMAKSFGSAEDRCSLAESNPWPLYVQLPPQRLQTASRAPNVLRAPHSTSAASYLQVSRPGTQSTSLPHCAEGWGNCTAQSKISILEGPHEKNNFEGHSPCREVPSTGGHSTAPPLIHTN